MASNYFMDFGNVCKMKAENITIQSDAFDTSTDDVMSWINFLAPNKKIKALMDDTYIQFIEVFLSNEDSFLNLNGYKIPNDSSYWYRRGQYKLSNSYTTDSDFLRRGIAKEYIDPIFSFVEFFDPKNGINKFSDNRIEKLNILQDCIELGLQIPETLITSKIERVKEFLMKHERIICKPVRNPFSRFKYKNKEIKFSAPTLLITSENIDSFPKIFLHSMFQEYIDKKVELRSFYLKGRFFTMAIFSQNNPRTMVDFRNYDHAKPNRVVPYTLPSSLQEQLKTLMNKNRLDSGSFDIILTPESEYIFLEVNPIGQFQWLSRNCNYFLEKEIAELLIKL
ncbi:MAG TPA: hypothetical protein PKJ74_10375 [Chitinophagales bacterium]|jgi:ATP-GRASP peptide maturase of grasp-with-spasm system|nr:hypothetical protein [Sphingobacteriales bacterium]HNK90701.1 hypothetical protein [Chitinophagales bacterium]MBK6888462.1 hypothetical protein [Sphingobacteriales bacterium]MBK7529017.1 hypothetical protein [Sphingobacteriales bacterium]MBK8678998.1 hypothetical protein [Sphingobacteriales bacterium]